MPFSWQKRSLHALYLWMKLMQLEQSVSIGMSKQEFRSTYSLSFLFFFYWERAGSCFNNISFATLWCYLVAGCSEVSGDRELQRTMLELLNQLDGFSSDDRVKVCLLFLYVSLFFWLMWQTVGLKRCLLSLGVMHIRICLLETHPWG